MCLLLAALWYHVGQLGLPGGPGEAPAEMTRRQGMGFFAIPGAGVGFFFCAWLTMIFWGMIAPDFDVRTIGYPTAMLITIALWLIVAPLAAATGKRKK